LNQDQVIAGPVDNKTDKLAGAVPFFGCLGHARVVWNATSNDADWSPS
jgi:hypothetical protein